MTTAVLNHKNCKCSFVSWHDVIFEDKQLRAQQWETPNGDRYFRVFMDDKDGRNYMRCWGKNLSIIE